MVCSFASLLLHGQVRVVVPNNLGKSGLQLIQKLNNWQLHPTPNPQDVAQKIGL